MKDKLAYTLATWFGSGLLKPAPGTWGTLAGLPVGIALLWFDPAILSITTLLFIFIGWWATDTVQKKTKEHDSSYIVIDEVIGIWIALLACSFSWVHFLVAFALFRFFDILKPWPIGWLDQKIKGAWGVLCDDIVAGLFAGVTIAVLRILHVF